MTLRDFTLRDFTLRDLGLRVVRALPGLRPAARRVYAALPGRLQDTPTRRIARYFAGAATVSFVQVGAYDGLAGDPIRPLVLARPGWRGVLVEPQPDALAALRETYAPAAGRLHFVEAALAARPGTRTLYAPGGEGRRGAALPDWAFEVASLDPEHVRRYFPDGPVVGRTVRAAVFAEVARAMPGGIVDLVVVDAEGHERPIIESIDLDGHRVRFLMYEHRHLAPGDGAALERRLRGAGFALKAFGRDTIAWRGR